VDDQLGGARRLQASAAQPTVRRYRREKKTFLASGSRNFCATQRKHGTRSWDGVSPDARRRGDRGIRGKGEGKAPPRGPAQKRAGPFCTGTAAVTTRDFAKISCTVVDLVGVRPGAGRPARAGAANGRGDAIDLVFFFEKRVVLRE